MDISIFGYKFNLEVLILIGVIYLILVGHTVCGCCNFGIMEGFDGSGNNMADMTKKAEPKKTEMPTQVAAGSSTTVPTTTTSVTTEGFTGANTNYGESSTYDLSSDIPVNTSSWSLPTLTVVPGQPLSPGVKQILARPHQPIPLPEGELLMFANTPFKPECCPNTYSNSTGCACMTTDQFNYLQLRGGNNVPYSEY
jgi:hypothetical protein